MNQYWSPHEPLLVTIVNHYWLAMRPVLVRSVTSTASFFLLPRSALCSVVTGTFEGLLKGALRAGKHLLIRGAKDEISELISIALKWGSEGCLRREKNKSALLCILALYYCVVLRPSANR